MAEPRRVKLPDEDEFVIGAHFLIVEARYYDDIGEMLLQGAAAALVKAHARFDVIRVPGALEIPAAIAIAMDGTTEHGLPYSGAIALGCVIRGETYHFDIVANESCRALMDMSVADGIAVGNGILTVENEEQALERALVERKNKGGGAADTALHMIALREKLGA